MQRRRNMLRWATLQGWKKIEFSTWFFCFIVLHYAKCLIPSSHTRTGLVFFKRQLCRKRTQLKTLEISKLILASYHVLIDISYPISRKFENANSFLQSPLQLSTHGSHRFSVLMGLVIADWSDIMTSGTREMTRVWVLTIQKNFPRKSYQKVLEL